MDVMQRWAKLLDSAAASSLKETQLLPDFFADVFVGVLGYTLPASSGDGWTLSREQHVQAGGKFADAVLGRFNEKTKQFIVAVEGKGPFDPLDRPHAGRSMSGVDQAYRYAINLPCDWIFVTSMTETRLYHKNHDQYTFERFQVSRMAQSQPLLERFIFLLGAERVVASDGSCHLNQLLEESERVGQRLTHDYYDLYAEIRYDAFTRLRVANPTVDATQLLGHTQKMLDRVLFISFCEDRGLLPPESIRRAFDHRDPYNPRPVWTNFVGLFRAVDEGNGPLNIPRYNGGLFARDEALEGLIVEDAVCEHFAKLAAFEYRTPEDAVDLPDDAKPLVDVDILGHIFEQSISDLERMRLRIESGEALEEPASKKKGKTKRRREGAFYTPEFVTRYIVSETVGRTINERFEGLRVNLLESASASAKKTLIDPRAYDFSKLNKPQKQAMAEFWEAWERELISLRIVDPACGSGAFLISAFDHLAAAYRECNERLAELLGQRLFDVDREILRNNLYGVDLNGEAIEICQLSLWIKTAQRDKQLETLDDRIRKGNSVVADPSFDTHAFNWQEAFPEVFTGDDGGFDIVLGNPPYVRQEWIRDYKPYFEANYAAYDGVADLYVYFYELGLNVLRPGGRLGFIVTNKWMKAGYGENLRGLLSEKAWVESVVDFGHAKQIFPDADVFPGILVFQRPKLSQKRPEIRACSIPREQLRIDDLQTQIDEDGFTIPAAHFGKTDWILEPPGTALLLDKIDSSGNPLISFTGAKPYRGILTGFNEAFLIDNATKESLINRDPNCESIIRPYLRGQDVERWQPEWQQLWMIAMKSSENHNWAWAEAGDDAESIFAKIYPSLFEHFDGHRDSLVKRQDQGRYWWELRSCAYWNAFEQPKILYQDIMWTPSFCLDTQARMTNNTVYFISSPTPWLLAVLNSPALWWFSWRRAQHGKDEALRYFTQYVAGIPIPDQPNEFDPSLTEKLGACIDGVQKADQAFADWLHTEMEIEKLPRLLQTASLQDTNAIVASVRKSRGKKNPLTPAGLKALRDGFNETSLPASKLRQQAKQLEWQLALLVNQAYGLTTDEESLLWKTAPLRMPIMPPSSANEATT
ncbi:MAG TPA: type I restriction endonuclease subunit M [Planctomycetaceae bacterium]|nr:type I restriction endonuclease subunit M [Planctomycetaceae bacterium]